MLKNKHKYLEITKSLAPDTFEHRTFHTTFIVRKNKIQKIGINCNKTHPKNLKYDYIGRDGIDIRGCVGVHSELSAILKYGKDDCSDCTFVNVRIDKNGNFSMAMPCRGCQSLLKQVGFKKVYYTDCSGNFNIWH
jgi:deoxycytidylate deaminase